MNKDEIVQKHIKGMQKHIRKQKLRDARRKAGVHNKFSKPRLKKISATDWDDWDDLDDNEFDNFQPILSKDETERRREIEKLVSPAVIEESGKDANLNQKDLDASTGQSALVVEAGAGLCRVDLDGQIILCDIRGKIKDAISRYVNPVAVGDWVLISKNGTERGVVEAVLPRQSVLARPYSPDVGKVID